MINIDFETRSATDLLTEGVYNYASCPTTQVICMAYSVDGQEPLLWHPGEPIPAVFHVEHESWTPHDYHAWNADFERLIWDFIMAPEHGFADVPLHQWKCTAFASRCNNLPNALGNAARCLGVTQQKSSRGRELIKLLCVPLADGTFCKDPALLAEMDEYCQQDVRTEQAVGALLRKPSDTEWGDYYANCLINDRGIAVDIPLCAAAQAYAQEEEAELVEWIGELTAGEVTKARGGKLKDWVVERLTPDQEKLLVKHSGGERKLSLDKYNRSRLLALDDMDPDVREVVEASDFAQKSSVGKFRAMQKLADPRDFRVRGSLMCNGASQSGRYSSRGAQVHNFPRDVMPDPVECRADFIDEIVPEDITDYYELPMMTVLSRMLRPALLPAPCCAFLVSDWSAIEGRVAPWLCDSPMGEKKLDLYRSGEDVYKIAAASIYATAAEKITKERRQIGKVAELSLQYGGGRNAFLGMARGYGVQVSSGEADRIKEGWRRGNPWAQHAWKDIERAAMLAIHKPGERFAVGRLSYFAVEGVLCGGTTLFCELPCGRLLTYPDARVEMRLAPWGDEMPGVTALRAAFVPKVGEKEWPRANLWGGLLFENAVQGTAASLLRYALTAAWRRGLEVVLHVHDEIVVESKTGHFQADSLVLHEIMNTAPAWADGLPVEAGVERMMRFGK